MSTSRSLTRRTALAGLGVGSLGFFATYGASADSCARASLIDHPLTGLWLARVPLPAHDDLTAAAPVLFGADGTAVLAYPCAEADESGLQFRSLAIGTWAPVSDTEARFTAVQACFDADGAYLGTRTYDGHPVVSDDGVSFTVIDESAQLTLRDVTNGIVEVRAGTRRPMFGIRMASGNGGFATYRMSDCPDSYQDPEEGLEIFGTPEGAPFHPGDLRNVS